MPESALGVGSSDRAMESLQHLLGIRLDGLCPESYATLLATEQIRSLTDFADPGVAMICFGRAVESQLRYQTEKRFGRSLKSLWRRLYPRRDNSNLGGFIYNLDSLSTTEAAAFGQEWIAAADARGNCRNSMRPATRQPMDNRRPNTWLIESSVIGSTVRNPMPRGCGRS